MVATKGSCKSPLSSHPGGRDAMEGGEVTWGGGWGVLGDRAEGIPVPGLWWDPHQWHKQRGSLHPSPAWGAPLSLLHHEEPVYKTGLATVA